jgi:hypothetical protein
MREQRQDFVGDSGFISANVADVTLAVRHGSAKGGLQDLFDARPVVAHASACLSHRATQPDLRGAPVARDRLREMSSACAVSSTFRPPKNRSSTTRTLRASITLEPLQGLVEREYVDRRQTPAGGDAAFIERHANDGALAASRPLGARGIHEHTAHQGGHEVVEVRAILPLHVAQVHEPQVDLVDERGGLQGVVVPLAFHVDAREPSQLGLHGGHQAIERACLARHPLLQENSHARLIGWCRGHPVFS